MRYVALMLLLSPCLPTEGFAEYHRIPVGGGTPPFLSSGGGGPSNQRTTAL
jgi:hypothetical protein